MRKKVNVNVPNKTTTVRNMKTESVWLCLQRTFNRAYPSSSNVFKQYVSYVSVTHGPLRMSIFAKEPLYGQTPDPIRFSKLVLLQFLP
jgi:hypothetical protein